MDAAERVKAVREEIQAPVSPTLEKRLAEMVRQAEQAARVKALEERDVEWTRWLAETQIATAEQNFDIETAIVCGGKKPTLHDAGQCGYGAGMFAWDAAIKKRRAAIRALKET